MRRFRAYKEAPPSAPPPVREREREASTCRSRHYAFALAPHLYQAQAYALNKGFNLYRPTRQKHSTLGMMTQHPKSPNVKFGFPWNFTPGLAYCNEWYQNQVKQRQRTNVSTS